MMGIALTCLISHFDTQDVRELLLPEPTDSDIGFTVLKLVLWVLVVVYTIGLLGGINPDKGRLLHLINLPFHEAGHVIFGLLGNDFIKSLGGALGQLIMPLICSWVLLLQQKDAFGASLAFWWFAENFIDLAPYIKDASVGELPLIGGNFGHSSPYGFHDFEYLLTETHLIAYDAQIAGVSYGLGCVLMLVALLWGGTVLLMMWQHWVTQ